MHDQNELNKIIKVEAEITKKMSCHSQIDCEVFLALHKDADQSLRDLGL